MADKDKKNDDAKAYFGKYDTIEEAEKGFAELNKKLAEQSKELGTMRKQVTE